MSFCTKLLKTTRLPLEIGRKLSASVKPAPLTEDLHQIFRTVESNPANHATEHLCRFYTVPQEANERLFSLGGLSKKFQKQVETFAELAILVRTPAVELISHLNRTDYARPPNKYVLSPRWFRYPKEIAPSRTRDGYIDLPLDAASWLVQFKQQNIKLLKELDLRVSKDYEWSSRESTKEGAPIVELIDLGISRVKYACDIMYALTDELKLASTAGKCTTLVAIDGFNAFFAETSRIKNDDHKMVLPRNVSLTEAFLNMTKYDWCNGAIVVTVDPIAAMNGDWTSCPRHLLGKEGFEHLDPFLPIAVGNYTPEEYDSVIKYYSDRRWIRNVTEDRQRELELLSARNPYFVMHYSTPM